jgi:predicted nucleic acid-binding Zn ribbon protein
MTWRPFLPPPAEREPRAVRESLDRVAARLGLAPPDVLGHVFTRWEQLVGPEVAAHATPRTLRDGTLTISVDHPAWATSLRILSADLIRRITEGVGAGAVTEIVVKVEVTRPATRANHRDDTPSW